MTRNINNKILRFSKTRTWFAELSDMLHFYLDWLLLRSTTSPYNHWGHHCSQPSKSGPKLSRKNARHLRKLVVLACRWSLLDIQEILWTNQTHVSSFLCKCNHLYSLPTMHHILVDKEEHLRIFLYVFSFHQPLPAKDQHWESIHKSKDPAWDRKSVV